MLEQDLLVPVSELTTYMDISLSLRQKDAAELVLSGLQSEMESFLRRPIELDEFTESHVLPSYFQGVPATSFFYDQSLDTTGNGLNYIQPSVVISLRNTPVVSVNSVSIRSLGDSGTYLAEAMKRDANITGASQSGTSVTFTSASHGFKIGQIVTVINVNPSVYGTSAKMITSVSLNTFTVADYAAGLAPYVSGGQATATGNDYTVQRYGIEIYRGFPNDVVDITYTGGLDGEAISMFKLMILRAATREMQNMHDDVVGVKDLNPRNVAPMETGFTEKELLALRRYRRRRI
jgi:hypothetical protein